MENANVIIYPQWMIDRMNNYPQLSELADALVHKENGDSSHYMAYIAACNEVKTQYPKP